MENNFALNIKKIRNNLNLTQADFAVKLGVTQAALSAYEKGARNPTFETILSISKEFNVSIDWLIGLSDIVDINHKPSTYSDVIRLLFKLEEANLDCFSIDVYHDEISDMKFFQLETTDYSMVAFSDEWKKMKELHDKKTIDDELYDLWIEKTLKKYNIPIRRPGNNFKDIPYIIDEELPFN